MTETDMYRRAYFEITKVLDGALGPNVEDGAGLGLAADVMLLAQRYADLKAAVLTSDAGGGWRERVAEIDGSPLRCEHGLPVGDECTACLAPIDAAIREKANAEVKS